MCVCGEGGGLNFWKCRGLPGKRTKFLTKLITKLDVTSSHSYLVRRLSRGCAISLYS